MISTTFESVHGTGHGIHASVAKITGIDRSFRFSRVRNFLAVLAISFMTPGSVTAQWIKIQLPATPRTADGKPNLSAPTPRTADAKPDLSGIWTAVTFEAVENLAGKKGEVPMQPWAAAVYKERIESFGRDKPQVRCMPHGVPDAMLVPDYPFKIIQTPSETIILGEEFNQFRQIFTDGRKLPVDPNPAWFGYSVGKWEGDTFVVESSGFSDDGSWLDNGGHPHTDALNLTERFRRLNFGTMELDVTVDDHKAYTKPWKSVTERFKLMPDTELIENLCDKETDAVHLKAK